MAQFLLKTIKYVPLAAAFIKESNKSPEPMANSDPLCRASELPIYTSSEDKPHRFPGKDGEIPSCIDDVITTTKQTLARGYSTYEEFKQVGRETYEASKSKIEEFVTYLREEENVVQRAGAIGITAAVGLLCGKRGGLIKKTFYATAGGLGMATICYPDEALQYATCGMVEAQNLTNEVYNFLNPVQEVSSKEADGVLGSKGKNPLHIIAKSHETAIEKSCDCPVDTNLGHSDKSPPPAGAQATNPEESL